MSEVEKEIRPKAPPAPPLDDFKSVLEGLVGKVVTVVNPESFEDAPVGNRLTTGFYRAKVINVKGDYLCVATEYVHKRGGSKEPVKQFIPLSQVKRVSLMKSDRIIHI